MAETDGEAFHKQLLADTIELTFPRMTSMPAWGEPI